MRRQAGFRSKSSAAGCNGFKGIALGCVCRLSFAVHETAADVMPFNLRVAPLKTGSVARDRIPEITATIVAHRQQPLAALCFPRGSVFRDVAGHHGEAIPGIQGVREPPQVDPSLSSRFTAVSLHFAAGDVALIATGRLPPMTGARLLSGLPEFVTGDRSTFSRTLRS